MPLASPTNSSPYPEMLGQDQMLLFQEEGISVKELRIVQIGDRLDMCPCAGTHVTNLGEIGHINILGKKSKGKGTQRIKYDLVGSPQLRQPYTKVL